MNSWWHFTFCLQSNSYSFFVPQKDLQRKKKTQAVKNPRHKKACTKCYRVKSLKNIWDFIFQHTHPTSRFPQLSLTAFLELRRTHEPISSCSSRVTSAPGGFEAALHWAMQVTPAELLDLSSVQLYQRWDTQSSCARSQVSPHKVHWQCCQGINQRLKSLGGSYDSKKANWTQ